MYRWEHTKRSKNHCCRRSADKSPNPLISDMPKCFQVFPNRSHSPHFSQTIGTALMSFGCSSRCYRLVATPHRSMSQPSHTAKVSVAVGGRFLPTLAPAMLCPSQRRGIFDPHWPVFWFDVLKRCPKRFEKNRVGFGVGLGFQTHNATKTPTLLQKITL